MVDPAKIAIIVNLLAPNSVKQLRTVLGHTGYYRKFIKVYAKITAPMEKLLKKDEKFLWNEECQQSLNTLKENMVTTPILVFPDWTKPFHVHVDASGIDRTRGCFNTTRRRRYRSSYRILQQKAIDSRKELHHDRKRRLRYGVRATEVQALLVGFLVQDVY